MSKSRPQSKPSTAYRDPKKWARYMRSYRRRRDLGIDPLQVFSMLQKQNWRCPLCGKEIDDSASADHDHATGTFRGMLCLRCNVAIAVVDDTPGWCERALAYLGLK